MAEAGLVAFQMAEVVSGICVTIGLITSLVVVVLLVKKYMG